MTENEAIEIINKNLCKGNLILALDVAKSSIMELQEYRAIGTVEECREAREKQRGKKPILSAPCKSINYYLCPDCGEILRINRPFCSKCGSAIDWSDTP